MPSLKGIRTCAHVDISGGAKNSKSFFVPGVRAVRPTASPKVGPRRIFVRARPRDLHVAIDSPVSCSIRKCKFAFDLCLTPRKLLLSLRFCQCQSCRVATRLSPRQTCVPANHWAEPCGTCYRLCLVSPTLREPARRGLREPWAALAQA